MITRKLYEISMVNQGTVRYTDSRYFPSSLLVSVEIFQRTIVMMMLSVSENMSSALAISVVAE